MNESVSRRWLLVGGLAALVVVAGLIAWSASVTQPSAVASPTPTPVPTTEPTLSLEPSASQAATEAPTPSPSPELAFTPPAGILPWGSVVVANTELRLYQHPADSDAPATTAAVGDRLTITGPLIVNGERWYLLRLADDPASSGYAVLDPAGDDVAIEPVTCPAVDAESAGMAVLASLTAWERLSCFGDSEMTLDGYEIVGFGGFRPGVFEPEWLNGYLGRFAIVDRDDVEYAHPLLVSVEPGVDVTRPPVAGDALVGSALLRVTGHFNHPASTQCTATHIPITDDLEGPTADYEPIAAEIACRQVFVVTGFEVLSDL